MEPLATLANYFFRRISDHFWQQGATMDDAIVHLLFINIVKRSIQFMRNKMFILFQFKKEDFFDTLITRKER